MMLNLYIDFLATYVENTGKLNEASFTQKIFRKDVYFSRKRRQTHKIVKWQPKFSQKPRITAGNPNPSKFNNQNRIYTIIGAYYYFQSYILV
jgi:hypothetical protein